MVATVKNLAGWLERRSWPWKLGPKLALVRHLRDHLGPRRSSSSICRSTRSRTSRTSSIRAAHDSAACSGPCETAAASQRVQRSRALGLPAHGGRGLRTSRVVLFIRPGVEGASVVPRTADGRDIRSWGSSVETSPHAWDVEAACSRSRGSERAHSLALFWDEATDELRRLVREPADAARALTARLRHARPRARHRGSTRTARGRWKDEDDLARRRAGAVQPRRGRRDPRRGRARDRGASDLIPTGFEDWRPDPGWEVPSSRRVGQPVSAEAGQLLSIPCTRLPRAPARAARPRLRAAAHGDRERGDGADADDGRADPDGRRQPVDEGRAGPVAAVAREDRGEHGDAEDAAELADRVVGAGRLALLAPAAPTPRTTFATGAKKSAMPMPERMNGADELRVGHRRRRDRRDPAEADRLQREPDAHDPRAAGCGPTARRRSAR